VLHRQPAREGLRAGARGRKRREIPTTSLTYLQGNRALHAPGRKLVTSYLRYPNRSHFDQASPTEAQLTVALQESDFQIRIGELPCLMQWSLGRVFVDVLLRGLSIDAQVDMPLWNRRSPSCTDRVIVYWEVCRYGLIVCCSGPVMPQGFVLSLWSSHIVLTGLCCKGQESFAGIRNCRFGQVVVACSTDQVLADMLKSAE